MKKIVLRVFINRQTLNYIYLSSPVFLHFLSEVLQ